MNDKKDYSLLSGLTLAYVGDAIYEVYIRDFLIRSGQTRPNQLHRMATHYVSAKAQHYLIEAMIEADILTDDEKAVYKRGRNAKSHTSAKNTSIFIYRASTGFEALMGYLHLTDQKERLEELIGWSIKKIGEKNEK
ncbi:Mini-ribonuclease 3 [Vagococcus carniphilus]|nr:Mini-ribonuclease 3 [Vagococcus carniphilus]MDT2815628.1 Mini-ribonuclease 3 [Vagococcus carniphilus]MDT2831177.1 Mini-ribonuclease 3 [Vagococcus carniphilus]MDT2839664.1 Mini-ribonuclease 3 [Vagococcus carniphilus]MDT2848841.1 Mini-ribonuclease 3 [Vagococcus carniphilus]MDT2854133.1 Mini-ribonuclease 3 [Vagococcus carniphilus]